MQEEGSFEEGKGSHLNPSHLVGRERERERGGGEEGDEYKL